MCELSSFTNMNENLSLCPQCHARCLRSIDVDKWEVHFLWWLFFVSFLPNCAYLPDARVNMALGGPILNPVSQFSELVMYRN